MNTTEGLHRCGRGETQAERHRRQLDAIARPAERLMAAMLVGFLAALVFGWL